MLAVVIGILAVAAAVIVALILAPPVLQSTASGLRRRFGPEYDRAVRDHDGDTRAALRDLSERVRRYADIRMRALPLDERQRYAARWAEVQQRFGAAPAAAVAEAADLLSRLAVERGYPQRPEQQLDALSLHHAQQVGGYRELRRVAGHTDVEQGRPEEMRDALLAARALFERLVAAQPADRAAALRRAGVPRQPGRFRGRHRSA
ncbi:hypothetical protein IHE55_26270 [Streptomyces pactum]|uniref:Secreted protein n=1 Tax=Streptomyces pactum TaxID=68249 RepID=A0ABS0NSB8_9ACTN|nr:hypothetical protein [Streptomyces pactum]MBH5338095.1 hypothetical protein [Streptomyces pactum]